METNNHTVNISELSKLLYKIVIQFGFYTQKTDQELDDYLQILTTSLKKSVELTHLAPELQKLSKTLARLIQKKNELQIPTLFIEYLAHKLPVDDLQCLMQLIEHNRFKTQDDLFASLDTLLAFNPAPVHEVNNCHNVLHGRLIHLLDAVNVPAKFHRQWLLLRQQCERENLSIDALNEIIDKSVDLFAKIKANALDEQQNFDNFLFAIMQRIGNIEETAQQVTNENKQSIEHRNIFSEAINIQVESIKTTTNTASELEVLQNSINRHLEKLSTQLDEHQQTEEQRQMQLQMQLQEITEKLQNTEAESVMLRNKLQVTHKLAFLDQLTGVANRLAYDQRIDQELVRWQRYKHPLSIIVWDIDHFKQINDNYGHKSGDKALTLIAQIILNNCRKSDFVARYGGEEFITILPDTTAENALIVANKIRAIVETTPFKARGDIINIHISAGIHQCMLTDSVDTAFDSADRALYQAKINGRNQCVLSSEIHRKENIE